MYVSAHAWCSVNTVLAQSIPCIHTYTHTGTHRYIHRYTHRDTHTCTHLGALQSTVWSSSPNRTNVCELLKALTEGPQNGPHGPGLIGKDALSFEGWPDPMWGYWGLSMLRFPDTPPAAAASQSWGEGI